MRLCAVGRLPQCQQSHHTPDAVGTVIRPAHTPVEQQRQPRSAIEQFFQQQFVHKQFARRQRIQRQPVHRLQQRRHPTGR